jgi:hypothetical protein
MWIVATMFSARANEKKKPGCFYCHQIATLLSHSVFLGRKVTGFASPFFNFDSFVVLLLGMNQRAARHTTLLGGYSVVVFVVVE